MMEHDADIILDEALLIVEVVVANGGMATKSAVEDVLMKMFDGLERYDAHQVMNRIEYNNMQPPDRRFSSEPAPRLGRYAFYLAGVDCHWARGNPLAPQYRGERQAG